MWYMVVGESPDVHQGFFFGIMKSMKNKDEWFAWWFALSVALGVITQAIFILGGIKWLFHVTIAW